VPIVEELAADIFQGQFTAKFVRAAQATVSLLRDSPYVRLYHIDVDEVLRLPVPARGASEPFAALCARRADTLGGAASGSDSFVVKNGRIIEQQQILTTHNLAPLLVGLDLVDAVRPHALGAARACVTAIGRAFAAEEAEHKSGLLRVKDAAYAWRQMMFFLSLAAPADAAAFPSWAATELARHAEAPERFEPALLALANAVGAPAAGPGRVLLGWTFGRHWLS
jgi:hypothetical protein